MLQRRDPKEEKQLVRNKDGTWEYVDADYTIGRPYRKGWWIEPALVVVVIAIVVLCIVMLMQGAARSQAISTMENEVRIMGNQVGFSFSSLDNYQVVERSEDGQLQSLDGMFQNLSTSGSTRVLLVEQPTGASCEVKPGGENRLGQRSILAHTYLCRLPDPYSGPAIVYRRP